MPTCGGRHTGATAEIPAATSSSYLLTAVDIGKTVTLGVTCTLYACAAKTTVVADCSLHPSSADGSGARLTATNLKPPRLFCRGAATSL